MPRELTRERRTVMHSALRLREKLHEERALRNGVHEGGVEYRLFVLRRLQRDVLKMRRRHAAYRSRTLKA